MMTGLDDLRTYLVQMRALRQHMSPTPPTGFNYFCTEDYVLDRGTAFDPEPLTPEELAHVLDVAEAAEAMFAERGFPLKQCFMNSAKLALADRTHALVYTEGYALGSVLPVHHAWLTLNDKVVDLTWRLDRATAETHRFRDRTLGTFAADRAYIGIGFQTTYLSERVVDSGSFLSLIDDYQAKYPLFREERLTPLPA